MCARFGLVVLLALGLPADGQPQTGFTHQQKAALAAAESNLIRSIEPAWFADISKRLSARNHVAGGPGQAAFRDSLVTWLTAWGFAPEIATYEIFLPWAVDVSLSLTGPRARAFELAEPALAADPTTRNAPYPWVNGYSAPGAAGGEVVYVHYGLHEDYARLDSIGVDVGGRIVLARYGRSYRGVKARLAEERGAAALLLYSDPEDDGYVRGDVYPEGPFRPGTSVQRGSVMNGTGDPTTPEGPSVAGASRIEPARSPAELPEIPVVPISHDVAGEILALIEGRDLPAEEWQGGLPFRYHVGPGPARVRVEVDDDRDGPEGGMKSIHDVVVRIEGSEWPEELVVVGAHIDAWGPGAEDNVSGTASVLAAARSIHALAEAGHTPRRTIVFAGWDAEEWGLIGSTEWVEEHAEALSRGGVAYINQDAVGGIDFGASASPSLKPFLREAARAVPAGDSTLYAAWKGEMESLPPIGNLGGGSDFAPFYNHLGIPSTAHGFGTPGGIYHSAYDTHRWMAEYGDPGFVHHARSAELTAILALRLADAEILPYDYAAFAAEMAELWRVLREQIAADELGEAIAEEMASVEDALADLQAAGENFAAARDAYLAGPIDSERSQRANQALLEVERALTRPEGLEGRAWYRNLTFAADRRNGYATLAFPSVAEAVRSGSAEHVRSEIRDLAARLRVSAAAVRRASDAIDE